MDLQQASKELNLAFAAEISSTLDLANEAATAIRELCFNFRRLKEAIELDLERLEARMDLITVAVAKKTQGAKP